MEEPSSIVCLYINKLKDTDMGGIFLWLHSNMRQEIVVCALDDGKKTSLSQEALININMRWILQPVKISASIFFHGRQFDLQTGRQSAPAGRAALVVVGYSNASSI